MSTFLTLIQKKVKKSSKEWLHQYRCICGRDVFLPSYKVNSLHTKSCGCKRNGAVKGTNQRHGISNHPLFGVWYNMIRRCYSTESTRYKNYGAMGVRMCDLWRNNFKEFHDWALANGWEKGLQIDKDIIPKKIGIQALLYSPELCCIVTNKQNCNERSTNRKIEYRGDVKTISQWADEIGVNQKKLRDRIEAWGADNAIEITKTETLKNI